MSVNTYTTYNEIRAALGVSELELDDTQLALPNYETNLQFELEDISTLLMPTYEAVSAIAEGSRTPDQRAFFAMTRLFSTYAVAKQLINTLKMFGLRRTTDGKAEGERFDPNEDVIAGINQGYSAMRTRLRGALAKIEPGFTIPAATTLSLVRGVGLATNPITDSAT